MELIQLLPVSIRSTDNSPVNQTIIILKEDLKNNPELSHYLSDLCVRVKELEKGCAFVPIKHSIVEIVRLLNEHKIAYFMTTQHVDTF